MVERGMKSGKEVGASIRDPAFDVLSVLWEKPKALTYTIAKVESDEAGLNSAIKIQIKEMMVGK
jgi:hypothetical protein